MHMTDISVLVDLPVYGRTGTYIGQVKNCILDLEARQVEGFVLTKTNPAVVEGGLDVAVPFRWLSGFDRIMVLDFFPEQVSAPAAAKEPEEDSLDVVEVQAA